MFSISDRISCIKATESPLSADVGLISGDSALWLYDVGNNPAVTAILNSNPRPKNVVLSHFHPDHVGGLSGLFVDKIYLGSKTLKYVHRGEIVSGDLYIVDGLLLHIFELPSSHAPGSLGLEVGEYCFLGDATYATKKSGRTVYNSGLLQAQLKKLKTLTARYFLLSHDDRYILPRSEVIGMLEEIYSRRQKNEPYIEI